MNRDDRQENFFFVENESYKKRFLRDNKRKKTKRIKIFSIGVIIFFVTIISVDSFVYPFLTSEAAISSSVEGADWSVSKEGRDSSVASILEPEPNQEQGLTNIDEDDDKGYKKNKFASRRINTNKRVTTMNPNSITALVNKQIFLPDDYEPEDLVIPDIKFSFKSYHQKKLMREEAARALEDLFNASDIEGLSLRAVSGYRSYDRQYDLFTSNVKRSGLERTLRTSAMPGCSEHQMGLAMDVSTKSVSYLLNTKFANTPEGKWLADNSYKYGYIIRYPEGKEDITGYSYEPWHIRYVGIQLAKELYDEDLTLEEYYGFEIDPLYYNRITYDNIEEFGVDPEDLKVKRRPVVSTPETEVESEIESEETEATEESGEAVDETKASTPTPTPTKKVSTPTPTPTKKVSTPTPTPKASTPTPTPTADEEDENQGNGSEEDSGDDSKNETGEPGETVSPEDSEDHEDQEE